MVVRGLNPYDIVAPNFEGVQDARERVEGAINALRGEHLALEKNTRTSLVFERDDLEIDVSLSKHESRLIGGVISQLSTCFEVLDESGDSVASMSAHISSLSDDYGVVVDGHTYKGEVAQQLALSSVLLAVGSLWEQSNTDGTDANLQAQLTTTEAVIRACMTGEAALDDHTQARLMGIGQSALGGLWPEFGHLHGWASASFALASHGPQKPAVYSEDAFSPGVAPVDDKKWAYIPSVKQTARMHGGAVVRGLPDVVVERGIVEMDEVSPYFICHERLVMNAYHVANIERLDDEGEVAGFRIANNADLERYTAPLP